MNEKIKKLKEIIDGTDNLVFFGGAGVSTESGIPDFRSTDGLYSQKYDFPTETIVSHTFFMKRNKDFFDFYKDKDGWHSMPSRMQHIISLQSGRHRENVVRL